MIVTYKTRAGETVSREVHIGSKSLVGMRVDTVSFTGWDEVKKIFAPESREWVGRCLIPAMRIIRKEEVSIETLRNS